MLCHMLTQAGADRPHSYFRVASIFDFASFWRMPPQTSDTYGVDYINTAIQSGTSGTDIFGLRTMWDSIDPLLTRLRHLYGPAANDVTQLTDQFGPFKFIHLSREDKVAQAVSLVIAEQTGLWHRHANGNVMERTRPPQDPIYDRKQIADELAGLLAEAEGWDHWFKDNNIQPYKLTYEALSAHPTKKLAEVLHHIGMDPSIADRVAPGTAQLANKIDRKWAAQFRQDADLPLAEQPS